MGSEYIWIVVGIALVLLEFVLPGFIIIFLGISAIAVGMLIWAGMPESNGLPFLLFAGLSVALLVFLRRRFEAWFAGKALDPADGVFEDIVGREATVTGGFTAKEQGRGNVLLRGAVWQAKSEEKLREGDLVTIMARDGILLTVRKNEA